MLVLSRRESETLVIGGQILIRVNRIRGNKVAIGIEAPGDIKITRGELVEDLIEEGLETLFSGKESFSGQERLLCCDSQ